MIIVTYFDNITAFKIMNRSVEYCTRLESIRHAILCYATRWPLVAQCWACYLLALMPIFVVNKHIFFGELVNWN